MAHCDRRYPCAKETAFKNQIIEAFSGKKEGVWEGIFDRNQVLVLKPYDPAERGRTKRAKS